MKTPLEQWWDDDVRRRRAAMGVPASMPSMLCLGARSPLGTTFAQNPAAPWMRWDRVFEQCVRSQMPRTS